MVIIQVIKAKKQRLGHAQKTIGDYCLLSGSPVDANAYYSTSLELARLIGDYFWYAETLEGSVCALLIDRMGQQDSAVEDEVRYRYNNVILHYQEAIYSKKTLKGDRAAGLTSESSLYGTLRHYLPPAHSYFILGEEFIRNKPREVLGIGCEKLGAERSKIRSRMQNFPEGVWAPTQDAGQPLRSLGARSGKLGGRSGARKFILIFINPYSVGILRRLVLVGFYISSSQRRFTEVWYQARSKERRKKTVLAHHNEEEEAYVFL
ncbi:hypothetical protein AgCh_025689 [Apium graveolens]